MKLRVEFGHRGTRREISWWGQLDSFPKLLLFNGKKWEWLLYDKDLTGQVDMILTFVELSTYDPNYNAYMDDFDKMFGFGTGGCDCGAIYTSFPWDHMRFCSKWSKWK